MRIRRLAVTGLPLLASVGVFGACAASAPGPEATRTTGEALINTANTTPTFNIGVAPPSIGGHGSFSSTTTGTYMNGQDLAASPGSNVNESTWINSTLPLTYLTANSWPGDMTSASSQAGTDDQLSTSSMQSIFNAWSTFFGGSDPTPTTPTTQLYTYTPPRGQWVRYTYGYGTCTAGAKTDPPEMTEQRERSARLYCAMRNALINHQSQSHTMTMGSEAAFSISIFGNNINFFVTEPTIELGASGGGPDPYDTSTYDGAQSFEIPMQFGTRFTPVQGLGLPGLSEVRYPVVLTTGETEALTRETRIIFGSPYCAEDMTVSHADAIQEQTSSESTTNSFPLFSIGPVDFTLSLTFSMNVGAPSNPDKRLLSSPPTGYSTNTRTGLLRNNQTVGYHDGAWFNASPGGPCASLGFGILPDGLTNSYWCAPGTGPTNIRANQDDDHDFWGTNSVSLTATLSGTLGISFGPLTVGLTASGGISGTASQDHILQDALIAESPSGSSSALPATALSVRPHTSANVSFTGLQADLNFQTPSLPFVGVISWTVQLFNTGSTPIANYDSDSTNAWPESSILRIGTWSNSGTNLMKQPTVYSHLPQQADYQSFQTPTGGKYDVDTCLADPTANPPLPPACSAQPVSGGPPSANLCVYTTKDVESFGGAACSYISSWASNVAPISAMNSCTQTLLQFLCSSVSHSDVTYVSHVLASGDSGTFGQDLESCLSTGAATNTISAGSLQSFAQDFQYAACDANGVINTNPVAPSGNPSTPPTVTGGANCN